MLFVFQKICNCYFIPFLVAPVITRPLVNYIMIGPHAIVPHSTVFICTAEGFPIPTISWRRINEDGSEIVLTGGGSILITDFSFPGLTGSSRLTIFYTNLTAFGEYACVATNEFGSDNVTLTVEGKGHHTYNFITI